MSSYFLIGWDFPKTVFDDVISNNVFFLPRFALVVQGFTLIIVTGV